MEIFMKQTINMLENEYWWGGVVEFAAEMPYHKDSRRTIDLNIDGMDQRSPLFLSNMGRYIRSDFPFVISFADGTIAIESDYPVTVSDGHGDLRGAHLAAAQHFGGDAQLPPAEFFRFPQYNTWIELMYNQNQKQILEYAHAIADSGLPTGILMIDEGWSEDYGVFDFYPGRFDDPKSMIQELHELGFTVMLWVTPYISPDSNAYRELRETDFLVRDKDGVFAVREWWNGFSCMLDLSNPEACAWLRGKLQTVQDTYQVDGFKFDAADPYVYRNDDRTAVRQPAICNTADYDRFAAAYPYNELRAVWNMGGTPLVCRLQDKTHTWDEKGLGAILPCTMMQGLLGYYYGCPDMIGGGAYGSFLGDGFSLDEELYLRWMEASVLCPMMQFSVAPWRVLSEENYRTVLDFVKFRERFVPYLTELAERAATEHEPIVRHLEYEFPHQGFARCNDMYMLGSRYLVIPMLEQGGTARTVTLPDGEWNDLDGNTYHGGEPVTLTYTLQTLQVLEKTA